MTTTPQTHTRLAQQAADDRQAANARYQQALKDSQIAAHRELVFTAAANEVTHVSLEPSDQGDHMTVSALDVDDDVMEALDDAAMDLPDTVHSYWATLPGVEYESSRRNGDRAVIDINVAVESLLTYCGERNPDDPTYTCMEEPGHFPATPHSSTEA